MRHCYMRHMYASLEILMIFYVSVRGKMIQCFVGDYYLLFKNYTYIDMKAKNYSMIIYILSL